VYKIFERLEKLVKAWVNAGVDSSSSYNSRSSSRTSYGDPDMDAAMAELDDFIDTSKTESEKKEEQERKVREDRARAERAREEQARRNRGNYGSGPSYGAGSSYADGTKAVIEDAYRYLGMTPYAPFAEVKTAYKKLLFKYHPDRNASSPEALKKATETSTRINTAFQIIEAYEESKKAQ
jgi:DnaJ-domain-containing protein 1